MHGKTAQGGGLSSHRVPAGPLAPRRQQIPWFTEGKTGGKSPECAEGTQSSKPTTAHEVLRVTSNKVCGLRQLPGDGEGLDENR